MKVLAKRFAKLINCESGGVLILVAFTMVVILGMAVIAIDVGSLYQNRRQVVNAADSSALAGMQEIVRAHHDGVTSDQGVRERVTEVVEDYLGYHGTDLIEVTEQDGSPIGANSRTVKVIAEKEAELFFVQAFYGLRGSQSPGSDVSASATAYVGPFNEWEGLRPIALKQSAISEEGIVIIDFHTIGPGNWGIVSFSGHGSDQNPITVADYIRNGYSDPVRVNCPDTMPASGQAAAGSQNEVDSALTDIVDEKIYVPIIEREYIAGGSENPNIVGFAKVEVDSYDQDQGTLTVRLIRELTVSEMNPDQSAESFGLVGIALIE